ncbi:plasmid mobilization protein [Yoonia sediminilitoris]|uniref:Uncharacterized protein n=1 Tax=Yoonia sediminilitoris TaxID=1286148 RepID=A0A2T6KF22_9RHOB|nr:hypothetical protein [Yoonia sediminilitoris]PUB13730.1 hypothetical protein C8N45_107191 [Yoonia sediminilitoris]RCW94900.1 hypothetical protein DFP92_107191 [Yoonia sediminilitoris]
MQHRLTASVPTSGDAGRHGRRASPTNPTNCSDGKDEKLSEKIDLRCTKAEKVEIKSKAKAAGVSASQLLREALGLADPRSRKPAPDVSPEIVLAVSRTTRDVQQLARKAREQISRGASIQQLEASAMIAALVAIDRRMSELLKIGSREDGI